MLLFPDLVKYLQNHHHISISTTQETVLRNIGYYHGYKGYRFIRQPSNKIAFTDFNEIDSLNQFDMNLKTLFYPQIMFIESALKNYVINAVLDDSKTETLNEIFSKSITNYKNFPKGSKKYKEEFSKRMNL